MVPADAGPIVPNANAQMLAEIFTSYPDLPPVTDRFKRVPQDVVEDLIEVSWEYTGRSFDVQVEVDLYPCTVWKKQGRGCAKVVVDRGELVLGLIKMGEFAEIRDELMDTAGSAEQPVQDFEDILSLIGRKEGRKALAEEGSTIDLGTPRVFSSQNEEGSEFDEHVA